MQCDKNHSAAERAMAHALGRQAPSSVLVAGRGAGSPEAKPGSHAEAEGLGAAASVDCRQLTIDMRLSLVRPSYHFTTLYKAVKWSYHLTTCLLHEVLQIVDCRLSDCRQSYHFTTL